MKKMNDYLYEKELLKMAEEKWVTPKVFNLPKTSPERRITHGAVSYFEVVVVVAFAVPSVRRLYLEELTTEVELYVFSRWRCLSDKTRSSALKINPINFSHYQLEK